LEIDELPEPATLKIRVRLFTEKMRSKGKSGKSPHHAAHALSLFFSLQTLKEVKSPLDF